MVDILYHQFVKITKIYTNVNKKLKLIQISLNLKVICFNDTEKHKLHISIIIDG